MKRIVMKISGEALRGEKYNIQEEKVMDICKNIKKLYDNQYQIAIVVGAGNLWRGRNSHEMNNIVADQIGMLGTVMNTLAIGECLKRLGVNIKTRSSLPIAGYVKPYDVLEAREALDNNKVLLIGGGTGRPLCTTDKATIQMAVELEADTILFGKNVNGVYDKDPNVYKDAVKLDRITHEDVLKSHIDNGINSLGVMDPQAEVMLTIYPIDVIVYDAKDPELIEEIMNGKKVGTLIKTLRKE